MSEQLAPQRDVNVPEEFTQEILGWVSWLEPVAEADLTEEQYEAMIQRGRAKQEYFRLLAHDPAVLLHRTRADFDIFFNKAAGLPRADREIAAAAASRLNGCVYCASVHAR
ncbi:MAG: carboxymuconolactone decarboxylase family protein, partial [Microbacterium sp.]